MKRTAPASEDALLREAKAIKRLLALLALKQGATQKEIAVALEVDQSVISRMLPGVSRGRER